MEATKLFKQNERLLYKQSWYYAVRYNMDFDDIKSQAFLIFCEALERPYRSSFTTFLFHRLRTLNDFCKQEKKIQSKMASIFMNFPQRAIADPSCFQRNPYSSLIYEERQELQFNDYTAERIAFFQSLEHLSSDGCHVVHGILKGKFEKPELQRQRPVGKYRIKEVTTREWGWSCERVEKVWDELKKWWINSN